MRRFLNKLKEMTNRLVICYLFLSLCNWSLNPTTWNGVSHVLLAIILLISYLSLKEE